MKIKSNIKIKSNLYIRGTADGSFSFADEDYIAQINTREALLKLRARAETSGAKLKLSENQQRLLSNARNAVGDMPSIGAVHSDFSLLPESVSMRDIEETEEPSSEVTQTPAAAHASSETVTIGYAEKAADASPKITQAPVTSPKSETVALESISMGNIEEPTEAAPKITQAPITQASAVPKPETTALDPVSIGNIEEPKEASPKITQASAVPRSETAALDSVSMGNIEETIELPHISEIPEIAPVAHPVKPISEKSEPPLVTPDPSRVNAVSSDEILAVSLDEVPVPKADAWLEGFSEIPDSDAEEKAVKASADSKIILDSVCYSEKLRILENRLTFISAKYPKKRILVLCKTETAAERIIRSAEKLSENHNLNIAALDVFAAKYLYESGEPAARITALSADEKIALFGEKMHTGDFADYDFCIIAELDEIIAYNIKTLLKILVLLECGFLMLTDRRRAVLEYSPESGYEKNFVKLCDVLPENTEKLAITDTKHRLSGEIGGLLKAVVSGKPSENVKNELLSKMRSADLSKLSHTEGETAVLCRNSGYAKYVSLMLRQNGMPHTLLSCEKPKPVRQLADILWDTHEKIITRESFIKRYVTRCGSDEAHADEIFGMLCGLIKRDPSEGLELARLAEVIMLGGIPADLVNAANDKIVVAEIGSANGKAFNTVFITADMDADNSGKLLYLAAAGRTIPPALLKIEDMPELISGTDSSRYVYVNGDQKPLFSLGEPGDVDFRWFIGGSMGDAVRKQAYISKNVKPGDSITLVLNDGAYDIVHGSTVIGKMSESFSKSLTAEYGGKRYLEALPEKIEGAYAANIFTVVSCCDPSEYEGLISPQFREHRFWYGVEIGGFAVKG